MIPLQKGWPPFFATLAKFYKLKELVSKKKNQMNFKLKTQIDLVVFLYGFYLLNNTQYFISASAFSFLIFIENQYVDYY